MLCANLFKIFQKAIKQNYFVSDSYSTTDACHGKLQSGVALYTSKYILQVLFSGFFRKKENSEQV